MPTNGTMRDYFLNNEEAEDAVSLAEAFAVTAWEMQFADGVRRRFDAYGLQAFMTEDQYENLMRIAKT
jgi:hypothetical protein